MNNGNYPYSVGINNKNFSRELKVDGQLQQYKNEEQQHKAGQILPFELDNINKYLSDVFTTLTQLRVTLNTAKKAPNIDRSVLHTINKKIDKVNEIILDIPNELDKIGL